MMERTGRAHPVLSIILVALLCSCARRAPMIQTLPSEEFTAQDTTMRSARIVEARPNGLLITMQTPPKVPVTWTRAALLRQHEDETPTLMHTISPDDSQRQTLLERGVTLLDRELEPAHRYTYVMALYDAKDTLVWRGRATSITWGSAPAPPEDLVVESMTSSGARISWTPREGWGVLVLRRTLGQQGTAMQRHAFIDDDQLDTYVDRDVAPKTGYVYRLAHARRVPQSTAKSYVMLGQPGPEVYAVLPPR